MIRWHHIAEMMVSGIVATNVIMMATEAFRYIA